MRQFSVLGRSLRAISSRNGMRTALFMGQSARSQMLKRSCNFHELNRVVAPALSSCSVHSSAVCHQFQAQPQSQHHEEEEEEHDEALADEATASEEENKLTESDAATATQSEFLGVVFSPDKVKKYSAEIVVGDVTVSGGEYWTALDAAKAYDELVDLYGEEDTPKNFPNGLQDEELAHHDSQLASAQAEWEAPEAGKRHADIIPVRAGEYFTLDEVLQALERERAIDVYTVDLAGKSSLADFMVFCTGKSQAHMRRMADMMIHSIKARDIVDEFDYSVEGRDCDDWMITDLNTIIVHFMDEKTRRILKLEDHWEHMVDNKHSVYGDMTEDEYMDRYGTSELMETVEEDVDYYTDEGTAKKDTTGINWK